MINSLEVGCGAKGEVANVGIIITFTSPIMNKIIIAISV